MIIADKLAKLCSDSLKAAPLMLGWVGGYLIMHYSLIYSYQMLMFLATLRYAPNKHKLGIILVFFVNAHDY